MAPERTTGAVLDLVSEPVPEMTPATLVVLPPSRLKLALKAPRLTVFVSSNEPLEPPEERKTVSPARVTAPESVARRSAAVPLTPMVPAAEIGLARVRLPPEKVRVAPGRTVTVPAEVPRVAVWLTQRTPWLTVVLPV